MYKGVEIGKCDCGHIVKSTNVYNVMVKGKIVETICADCIEKQGKLI